MESSVHNGNFLTFDVKREKEIVAAFERSGYECENDDALVRRASGWFFSEGYD